MEIQKLINISIRNFCNDFKSHPNLFINNESDLKCFIYSKILEKIKEINGSQCLLLTEYEVLNKISTNNNSKNHPNKYDIVVLDKEGFNKYYNYNDNKAPHI